MSRLTYVKTSLTEQVKDFHCSSFRDLELCVSAVQKVDHKSSHPGHDVVVKAVDKVHQFDPQQTHTVNLLIYRLLDFHLLSLSSLQFLTDGSEIYEEESF